MNTYVMIKSFSNGLKIFLDDQCTFAELLECIRAKFDESKNFFKGAKVAISFEGRQLSVQEEKTLIRAMEEAGTMSVLYVIGKDVDTNENFARAIDRPMKDTLDYGEFGKFYAGSVRKGERLETQSGVVIMGDVEPGGTIIAHGSIVILGSLFGTAICETSFDPKNYFVAAMYMSPEGIRIGNYKYYSKEKSKWIIKPKTQPKIAFFSNEQVCVDNVSSDLLVKLSRSMKE